MKKMCVMLTQKVYVKPSFTYRSLLGKAVNKPDSLTTIILSFMLASICGVPKYLCCMLPVFKLTDDFLFEQ